jgi:hypothetical protein
VSLDSYFKQILAKRGLKTGKEGTASSSPRMKYRRGHSFKDDFPVLHEDSDKNTPYGFCGLKYCSAQSAQKGGWIGCQKCGTWYHEGCDGAAGTN